MAECRTLVQHPAFWRMGARLPPAARPPAPAPVSLTAAPAEALHHIASYLDTARDLLSFGAVCRTTRCGGRRAGSCPRAPVR
jgi:hypothetical protein